MSPREVDVPEVISGRVSAMGAPCRGISGHTELASQGVVYEKVGSRAAGASGLRAVGEQP